MQPCSKQVLHGDLMTCYRRTNQTMTAVKALVCYYAVSITVRYIQFHWKKGHDKRTPEGALNEIALNPFTGNKT